MENNVTSVMRCPFRTDKDGNFCECYGKDCMAYCEYEEFHWLSDGRCSVETPALTRICRRLAYPVTCGGCV